MTKNGVWFIGRNGTQRGPMSHDQFVALRNSGELRPTDLIWREGWPDWVAAEQVPEATPPQSPNTRPAEEPVQVRKWDRNSLLAIAVAFLGMLGALGGGILSDWNAYFPRNTLTVEDCDRSLGKTDGRQPFSGIYAGVVETGQSRADVQLKLVRNGNTIQGSYFRDGLCGKVFGDVVENKLVLRWSWGGSSGRAQAVQQGKKLAGTSGFDGAAAGGGTFELYQRE